MQHNKLPYFEKEKTTKEERISLRILQPNPLFEQWLQEWLNQAIEKDSQKRHALAKALESLRKYPLVLHSGRDCSILEGFGANICKLLDQQLAAYKQNNAGPIVETETELNASVHKVIQKVQEKISKKRKSNCLARKKGKTEIEQLFEKYDDDCDCNKQVEVNSPIEGPSEVKLKKSSVKRIMERNSYKILLLVDTAETIGKSKRNLDATIQTLKEKNVEFEVRHLSVGDFVWIGRDIYGNEAVLPYIIERKRMDDLASSIKDGRFHEQKFRLKDSGIPNVIYLIESRGGNQHLGLPIQNLLQAITNTEIHNGYSVKYTDSHADSMFYLSVLTNCLIEMFKTKDLVIKSKADITTISTLDQIELMDFNEFNASSIKTRNFRIIELFTRQLLQLKSLSIDKAIAITDKYPTPRCLITAYRECTNEKDAELLLANLQFGQLKKPIGPVISRIIYNFYTLTQPS